MSNFSEYPIHVDQLCPGLFVRLESSGRAKSPFLRNSFKIKNQKQVEKIKRAGFTHVTCVLNKSDTLPIPLERKAAPSLEEEEAKKKKKVPMKTPVSRQLLGLKRETIERNKERKERFARCEKQYEATVSSITTILRRASGKAEDAMEEAGQAVDAMVGTFLSERDVVINLMTNKPAEGQQNLHALNVTVLSMILGKEFGLDSKTMHYLGMGALFHDIGKGRIPMSALKENKVLSIKAAAEKYYKQHPALGVKLVTSMAAYPSEARHIILQHHENIDGSGFPKKLQGNDISPLAKIVAVTNAYDNLCNPRDGGALTPHDVLKKMYSSMKKMLDGKILSAFIRNMGVYPPGTVVQLSNGLYGMVVSTNLQKAARPGVLVYHPEVPKKEALIVDLTIETNLDIIKTLRPEELSREMFAYLSPSKQINYYADTVSEAG